MGVLVTMDAEQTHFCRTGEYVSSSVTGRGLGGWGVRATYLEDLQVGSRPGAPSRQNFSSTNQRNKKSLYFDMKSENTERSRSLKLSVSVGCWELDQPCVFHTRPRPDLSWWERVRILVFVLRSRKTQKFKGRLGKHASRRYIQ